jgi:hypothetical protein
MVIVTKGDGAVLWSGEGEMTSSSPVTRRLAWTRVLHLEDREGVTELIIPLEITGDGWAMELVGGQRRAEGLEGVSVRAVVPA